MKKTMFLAAVAAAMAMTAGAKPGAAVLDGYPDWQGAVDKNHISGRYLCASDLRHKVTVVVDIEAGDNLAEQLAPVTKLVSKVGLDNLAKWEWETNPELPRDVIVVLSNCGGPKDAAKIKETLESKDLSAPLKAAVGGLACSVYTGITFEGAPDSAGKRPFVYVMGPEGKEPLYSGTLDEKSSHEALKAIETTMPKVASMGWKPFFGSLPDPVSYPTYGATIAKGKSLAQLEATLLKDIAGKDEDKAKEAQILYDALEQTRSDIGLRARAEIRTAPHRAYYDVQQLAKYWPKEKQRFAMEMAKINAIPQAKKLAAAYCDVMTWINPEFTVRNAGEAKKVVGKLQKIKKDLAAIKDLKDVPKQLEPLKYAAMDLDSKVDMLIDTIPNRLPEK